MQPAAPPITVVIPTLGTPTLEAAIRSALAVSNTARVIVVDDAEQPIPASRLARIDSRIDLIRRSATGPSAARNAGLDAARTPHILLLDDDDELVTAGVFAAMYLGDRLHASAVVAARTDVLPDNTEQRKPVPEHWADRALPNTSDLWKPIGLFGASGVLLRPPATEARVRFDEDIWIGEDRDMLTRAAAVGPIAVSSQTALRVRIHPHTSANLTSPRMIHRRIGDHLTLLDRHLNDDNAAHWQASTTWLIKQIAKHGGPASGTRQLLDTMRAHRWPIPAKARLRLLTRKLSPDSTNV
ncbi:MAG: glycosyltransferase [Planctomycetota bacterium]